MLLDSEREGGPGVIYAPKFSVKSVFNAILPMSAMPPEKLRRCKHEKWKKSKARQGNQVRQA